MKRNTKPDPLSMQPARPVIFGEVLFDCFKDREVPGGAPLNVAWHLHALGWNPLLISRIGADEAGRRLIERMRVWGMDVSGIQHDPQHPTGRVEITMEGRSHTFDILKERAYDFIQPEAACTAADRCPGGILYHGSLALRGESQKALKALRDELGLPVFLDINLREPWWSMDGVLEMIRRARILKVNDEELKLLSEAWTEHTDPSDAVRSFCDTWELDAVWLTLGKKGALHYSADSGVLKVAPDDDESPVVDTVGAGDSFCAALLGGYLKGSSPEETADCATRLATRICGQQGATALDAGLYRELEAVTNEYGQ